MNNLCQQAGLIIDLDAFSREELVQFILNPSSINLEKRVKNRRPKLQMLCIILVLYNAYWAVIWPVRILAFAFCNVTSSLVAV